MTEIDKKIVAFIVDYYKEHQFYPTYSEIAEGIQRAKSTVHIYIKNLEEEGIIIRKTNCSSRYRLLNMDFINGIRGSSTTEQISFQQIVIAIRKELLKHEELYEGFLASIKSAVFKYQNKQEIMDVRYDSEQLSEFVLKQLIGEE